MGWILNEGGEMVGQANRKISSDERQAIARKVTRRFAPGIEAARIVESGETGFRNCAFCRKPIFVQSDEFCRQCKADIAERERQADSRQDSHREFRRFAIELTLVFAFGFLLIYFFG